MDPFRIFNRIELLDLADVYVDNFLKLERMKGGDSLESIMPITVFTLQTSMD